MSNIEKEMKALLYNFWITKDDKELYSQIKSNQNKIKDFVSKNLGSNLIIHDKFIKLEKIPTIIKENAKLDGFTSKLDYIILSIMLLFLEDKPKGDIFILSDLIDYVKNTAITLKLNNIPDWNKMQDRKSLLNVIQLLLSLNIIKLKDEGKVSFIESMEAEALYESLGTSNYLMRLFNGNINDLKTPEDFIKQEFTSQDSTVGTVRKYNVFRNILYTTLVSSKDLTPSELDYIKKNRNYIRNEIEKNLGMDVEITHNMAILYDEDSQKDNFPNSKKITEIVLMINTRILSDIKNNKIVLDNNEIAIVKESYFESIVNEIKKEKEPYIGKTLLKENNKRFYDMVLEYMQKYNFIEKNNDEIIIYPSISRIIGKTKEVEKNIVKQESLFGGNDEL